MSEDWKARAEAAEAQLRIAKELGRGWLDRAEAAEAALAEANEAADRWQTNYEAAAEVAHRLSIKYEAAEAQLQEIREALKDVEFRGSHQALRGSRVLASQKVTES